MTTGQRVGYFLNEWTAAILIIGLLCAGAVFFADRTDWKTPAVIATAVIGVCVPFWIRKYFAVRSSIGRTTAGHAMENLGDIQGIDNLAQAATISGQATAYTPPAEAPKTGGSRWMWQVRLAILAVAGRRARAAAI